MQHHITTFSRLILSLKTQTHTQRHKTHSLHQHQKLFSPLEYSLLTSASCLVTNVVLSQGLAGKTSPLSESNEQNFCLYKE